MNIEEYYRKVKEAIICKAKATEVKPHNIDDFFSETIYRNANEIVRHFNSLRRSYSGNYSMRYELAMLSVKQEAAVQEYIDYMKNAKTVLEKTIAEGKKVYALDDTEKTIADVPVTAFFTLEFEAESTECFVGGSYVFDKELNKVVTILCKVSRLWGAFTNILDNDETYDYTAVVTAEDYSNILPDSRLSLKEQERCWMYWRDFYSGTISKNTDDFEKGIYLKPNFVYYVPEKDDSTNRHAVNAQVTAKSIEGRLKHFNSEDMFGKLLICSECQKVFRLPSKEIAFFESKGLTLPKRCRACRVSGQKKICCDCGNEFTLRASEMQFYKSKGFELPKRCPDCRKARKEAKRQKE